MNQSATPPTLTRGWRQSLRTGAWYRSPGGWSAIVNVSSGVYQTFLERTAQTFEDALADANDVLEMHNYEQ